MARLNENIFRMYDIRGEVDIDLDKEIMRLIGRAFGTVTRRKKGKTVIIAHDCRHTSRQYADAVIDGLRSTGCDVTDLGLLPTPGLYYGGVLLKPDAAAMITASHNPMGFNGIKMSLFGDFLLGDEIKQLYQLIANNDFESGNGSLSERDIRREYTEMLVEKTRLDSGSIKVVIDAGNGMASEIAPKVMRAIGAEVIELFCEYDGSFPNHHPDPTVDEYIETMRETVMSEKADLGIGYDGDSDRIGVCDAKGNIIRGDKLLALFCKDLLTRKPDLNNKKIIFDVKCSRMVPQYIIKYGGEPIMYKTGHSLIKKRMKQLGCPISGEMSGHIFFKEDFFGYDDAIYASALLLKILTDNGTDLEDYLSDYIDYPSTPELKAPTPDDVKFEVVERMRKYYANKGFEIIDLDGVRVEMPQGWGLIRCSNTTPVLVLRMEGETDEALERIKSMIFEDISKMAPEVDIDSVMKA